MVKSVEMPVNYKQTEVGIIPEDWDVKRLSEICSPSKARINPLTATESYLCVELEHLSQETGRLLGYSETSDLKSQKSVFQKNDILFGKLRPYLRKYLFADFDGVCTTEIWVLKSQNDTDCRWLYYLVQSNRVIEAANQSTGTKMPRAVWKTVGDTPIPFPPTINEQIDIATALSDTDALIENLEKLIIKKRNIKQGAMQELLKPKEDWELKKYGEVFNFITTATYSRAELNEHEEVGYIHYGDIHTKLNFFLDAETFKFPTISYQQAKNYHHLRDGDIIIVDASEDYAGVGKSVEVKNIKSKKVISGLHTFLLRDEKKILADGFRGYLHASSFIKKQFDTLATGLKVYGVSRSNLKKVLIPIPSKEEQKIIADTLIDMDKEIEALERKLQKFKMIKQGMMQVLLTGKIRLV